MGLSRILVLILIFAFSKECCSMEKYDDAEYHFSEKILKEKGEEYSIKQSYVHGGMYLKWALDNELTGGETLMYLSSKVDSLKARKIKGSELLESLDGVLDSEFFSDEGQKFSRWYFGAEKNSYFEDYEKTLAANLSDYLLVEDSWDNYERMDKVISSRYKQWKNANKAKQ
jgi:hypothetical protein